MEKRRKVTERELTNALVSLKGWEVAGGRLHREFGFKNFVEAFSFMTGVALIAERMNHHPDWSNVYNRVIIDLVTHDLGGISTSDLALASAINALLP